MSSGTMSPEAARLFEQLQDGGVLPGSPVADEKPRAKAKAAKGKSAATTGRFQTMNEFVDYSARLVDTTAQAVWLVLFRDVKPNGVATISQRQIADRIGVSRRTAIRAIHQLETARLVSVKSRGGLSGEMTTYQVHGVPSSA